MVRIKTFPPIQCNGIGIIIEVRSRYSDHKSLYGVKILKSGNEICLENKICILEEDELTIYNNIKKPEYLQQ